MLAHLLARVQPERVDLASTGDAFHDGRPSLDQQSSRLMVPLGQALWPAVRAGAAFWLATRVGLAAFTYFTIIFNHPGLSGLKQGSPPSHVIVQSWCRWDCGWYYTIAFRGYWTSQASAFFPLYPALVHGVGALIASLHVLHTLDPYILATLLVANVAALAAFVGIALLARQEDASQSVMWGALALFAAYPYTFFLAAGYTESLFIASAIFALIAARRGWWLIAAVAALVATFTRGTGLILVLPLLWEFGHQHHWWTWSGWRSAWHRRVTPRIVATGLLVIGSVPLAFGGYGWYLWRRFGDPLAFQRSEALWGRHLAAPWSTALLFVQRFGQQPPWAYSQMLMLLDGVLIVAFVLLVLLCAARVPFAFTLYSAALVAIVMLEPAPSWAEIFPGLGRLLLPAVPLFFGLAVWMKRKPGVLTLIVGLMVAVQAGLATFWLNGVWVA